MDYGVINSLGAVDLNIDGQTQGDILYFNGTNWVRLAAGTANTSLRTNGVGANPAWEAVDNATGLTILNQGQGDILYFNGSSWVRLAAGTADQLLKTNGPSQNPSWTDAPSAGIPSGGIIMWSGAIVNIPSGWYLCDGTNGTPNMIDRFIVGAGSSYAVGATGGAVDVTLTAAQSGVPAHSHPIGSHTHAYQTFVSTSVTNENPGMGEASGGYATPNVQNRTTGAGSGNTSNSTAANATQSHTNLPPYYALAYIMKS